jgi:hemerythrin
MSTGSLRQRKGDDLVEEHLRLQAMLEHLHQSAKSKTKARKLVQELTEVRQHMRSHFAYEEEGGYLHAALAGAVHLNDAAAELLKQHTSLLQQLDHLIDGAQQEKGNCSINAEFSAKLDDFLRRFQDHERGENELIQRALDEEISAAD